MTPTAADAYRNRFRKVLEHIDAHLEEELPLEKLSALASFSKFHFHRQFSELLGLAIHQYVHLARMKHAAYALAFRNERPILEIALACGYQSHESFSRAFRKTVGQTPSAFRRDPRWDTWQTIQQPLNESRSRSMNEEHPADAVRVIDFPETRAATLEHRGAPHLLVHSIRRFIEWRKDNRLPPRVSATFNVLYDDPETTPPAAFRFALCAATDREIAGNAQGVVAGTIPAGRCAVLRHVGPDDRLPAAVRYLYATWLPESGEEPRDFPLFLQRLTFFPDVPEQEAITDIFLPIR